MAENYRFDYYYGAEADQFSFIRVPKALIKDKRFKSISSDAKLLYGLLLDRMSLSMKNKWLDDENRVYMIDHTVIVCYDFQEKFLREVFRLWDERVTFRSYSLEEVLEVVGVDWMNGQE